MSVLDQIRGLEQQVLQRLRELRPLVAEYRDLEKVAHRLGLKRDGDHAIETAAPEAAAASPQSKPGARRRARRAAGARASKRAAAGKPKATAAATPKAAAKPKPKTATAKPKAGAKPRAKAAAKPKPRAAATAKPAAVSTPEARGLSEKPKPSTRKRSVAAPGQREQDVLRLVGERPGVTVAELQVDATGLYGVVRRLQGRGQISKDGTQLRPSEAAASAGDDALNATTEPPSTPADTPAATGESSAPAAGPTAGASAAADESS